MLHCPANHTVKQLSTRDTSALDTSNSLCELPGGPDTGVVQRVYLDQNKWIDLANARASRKEKPTLSRFSKLPRRRRVPVMRPFR
jgi:hypothetical protein